jgi:multiple sugar transport system substrate-binding protein
MTAARLATPAAMLTVGCTGQAGRQAQRATSAANNGVTELRFWNGFTGPDGKAMEALIRRFQAENPDVRVRMQIIPWGTYYDKITLSLAYGGAPDLFIMHAGRLPEFASFGTLRPLADLYAGLDEVARDAARFAPIPWEASFYENKQLALPLDVHPIGLYYNPELFEQAGIVDGQGRAKPPSTWDEFLDAARKTHQGHGQGRTARSVGLRLHVPAQQLSDLCLPARRRCGDGDGKRSLMDAPETIAAARQMRDLIYKYKVAPKPEGVDAWLAFRQGRVGMALEGIYMLSSLEEQKGLRYAGAPVPQFGPIPRRGPARTCSASRQTFRPPRHARPGA